MFDYFNVCYGRLFYFRLCLFGLRYVVFVYDTFSPNFLGLICFGLIQVSFV